MDISLNKVMGGENGNLHLGPAMKALTPLQRRFVIALFERPGLPKVQCLDLAGYRATTTHGRR